MIEKLKICWKLLLSKNYAVICDRHSSAIVRHMFMQSYIVELDQMRTRFEKEQTEYTKGLNK